MSLYQSVKYWSQRDISTSSAPVVVKNEFYVLDINGAIEKFNMEEDDEDSETMNSDHLGVKEVGYEFLLKNAVDEIRLFWTDERFDLKVVQLKTNRDDTLHNPLLLAPGSKCQVFGKEGDDEPLTNNATGIFRAKWTKRGRGPIVELRDLVSENKYVVKFPEWTTRGAQGNNEFFLARKKLFGVDMRHLYLCSIELDGKNFEVHDVRVPPELDLPIQYQKMFIAVNSNFLYIVYSGPLGADPVASRLRERKRHFAATRDDQTKDDAYENPMVLRVNLLSYEVDKVTLIWPEGEHKTDHSCRITVEEDAIYLSGFCSEKIASEEGAEALVECRETHIYRFDKHPEPDSSQSQSQRVSAQSRLDHESDSDSTSTRSPSPKQRKITESDSGSDAQMRSPSSKRKISESDSDAISSASSVADQPGPPLKCSDCAIVLNGHFISDRTIGNYCSKCFARHGADNENGYERRVSAEQVLKDLEAKKREAAATTKEMEFSFSSLLEKHELTMEAIEFAGKDLKKLADESSYVNEDVHERHLSALSIFIDQQKEMLKVLKESLRRSDIPIIKEKKKDDRDGE